MIALLKITNIFSLNRHINVIKWNMQEMRLILIAPIM